MARHLLSLLVIATIGATALNAATVRTWSAGNGTWGTVGNWSDADVPDSADEAADTNTSTANTVGYNLDGVTIDGLWVRTGDQLDIGLNNSNAPRHRLTVATTFEVDGSVLFRNSNTNQRERQITYDGAAFVNRGTV